MSLAALGESTPRHSWHAYKTTKHTIHWLSQLDLRDSGQVLLKALMGAAPKVTANVALSRLELPVVLTNGVEP
jgi:hypothetical protein